MTWVLINTSRSSLPSLVLAAKLHVVFRLPKTVLQNFKSEPVN